MAIGRVLKNWATQASLSFDKIKLYTCQTNVDRIAFKIQSVASELKNWRSLQHVDRIPLVQNSILREKCTHILQRIKVHSRKVLEFLSLICNETAK